MQPQGSSCSYYQDQLWQPFDENLFLAFKEDIKRDIEAIEMRLPIMEPKVDANMTDDIGTNLKNINREMYAIMERTARRAEE